MILDEDTGSEIECPICYADEYWRCGHLVASFDRTFGEFSGGALSRCLAEFLAVGDAFEDSDSYHLALIELFQDKGAYLMPGSIIAPGGPGMTSSIKILFAENPLMVVDEALIELRRL
jgi:hypothetical protein